MSAVRVGAIGITLKLNVVTETDGVEAPKDLTNPAPATITIFVRSPRGIVSQYAATFVNTGSDGKIKATLGDILAYPGDYATWAQVTYSPTLDFPTEEEMFTVVA